MEIIQFTGQLVASQERIARYRARAIKRAAAALGRTVRLRTAPASAFHELRRQLEEHAFYPAHKPRKPSPQYRAVHARLVKQNGCRICGVTNDTLRHPAKRADFSLNPFGAMQLETHHCVIEWALTNAIDPDKFNRYILPFLRIQYGAAKYHRPFTARQLAAWIDHNEDNLWVLCDVHHRAKFFGIHEITGPIWGPQDILRDEFIARMRDEIAKPKRGKKGPVKR